MTTALLTDQQYALYIQRTCAALNLHPDGPITVRTTGPQGDIIHGVFLNAAFNLDGTPFALTIDTDNGTVTVLLHAIRSWRCAPPL